MASQGLRALEPRHYSWRATFEKVDKTIALVLCKHTAKSQFIAQSKYILFQKSVNNLLFCLLLCETKGHELNNLFTCDFTYSRLMNKASIYIIGSNLGDCANTRVIHNDSVSLGVTVALAVSVNL